MLQKFIIGSFLTLKSLKNATKARESNFQKLQRFVQFVDSIYDLKVEKPQITSFYCSLASLCVFTDDCYFSHFAVQTIDPLQYIAT